MLKSGKATSVHVSDGSFFLAQLIFYHAEVSRLTTSICHLHLPFSFVGSVAGSIRIRLVLLSRGCIVSKSSMGMTKSKRGDEKKSTTWCILHIPDYYFVMLTSFFGTHFRLTCSSVLSCKLRIFSRFLFLHWYVYVSWCSRMIHVCMWNAVF